MYRDRVINRLCNTVGRDPDKFTSACTREGGISVVWGDQGFYFKVFPGLPLIIARFDGDGELPPGASFVYPDNGIVSDKLYLPLLFSRTMGRAGEVSSSFSFELTSAKD